MFRFPKTLDPITLFHSPTLSASNRALQILKAASACASEASASSSNNNNGGASQRGEFQLDVTTEPPTTEQLRSILDYLGAGPAPKAPGDVVQGASDVKDAMRRYTGMSEYERGQGFVRPVIVDWINGKAIVGDDKSEILKMVMQLPNEGQ